MAAAGVVTVAAGSGWIAKLDTASNLDIGRGIAVDANGNVYVTGQANATTATAAYVFVAKYDTTGVIQWQRKLDTASQTDIGYGIAVDGSGNVYVTGAANTTTAQYVFIAKYNTSGVIQWQRSLDVASKLDTGYGIAVDTTGNVYVIGQANATTASASYIFIAKYDTSGAIQWQRKLDSTTAVADIGYGIAVDGSGNVYVTGQANTATSAYVFIAKYDTTGVIQWQRSLDTASNLDTGYGIAVDTTGNVYITGQANATTATAAYVFIAKYNTSGVIQWQRSLDTALQTDIGYGIAVDGSGNVYVTGQANPLGSTAYAFVAKYNTGGAIQWQRKLDTALQTDIGFGIAVDATGNIYVTGNATGAAGSNATAAYAFIAKLPADGTIPGTGTYVVGGSTLTYSAATMTEAAASLTDAAGTLTTTTISVNHWIAQLDTSGVFDTGYGIAVDGSGNVYVTGQANTATAAYVFIAKYDTTGVIQWQRSLDTASNADAGYGIAVDATGNVYVTGAANTNAYVFIAKYDTSGVIQWQVILDNATVADTGAGIAVDGSGNVYVTGQAGGASTAAYVFIVKYNTSGVIQWQRKLDTASVSDTGTGIAVDGSGNVYVTGQGGGDSASTTSYIFIVKYNTSGVIQWQRKLDTSVQGDSGHAIAVDGSGNAYVTGQANTTQGSGLQSLTLIAKYDTSGVIQWQRTLNKTSNYDMGYGIAVDGSGNVYVTGQSSQLTGAFIFIAKYDTTGVIQWQRSLDTASQPDIGNGIAADNSGNIYVTGQANTTTAAYVFIAKLPADGTILPGAATLTMAASTLTDAAGTLTDSAATMTDSAGSMVSSNVTPYWFFRYSYGTNVSTGFSNIVVDASNNIYFTGTLSSTSTSMSAIVGMINSAGNLVWSKTVCIGITGGYDVGTGIAVDSAGYVYVSANSITNTSTYLVKLNNTGVVQWERKITGSGSYNGNTTTPQFTGGLVIDGSSNVYVTTGVGGILKYNSAGVLQWQRNFGAGVVANTCGITIDTVGNIYTVSNDTTLNNVAAGTVILVKRDNSTGGILWQRSLSIATVNNCGYGIAVDGSDNVYITGSANGAGVATTGYAFIAKYDTTGAKLWQKQMDGASTNDYGYGVAVDSSNNVYVCGQKATGTISYGFFAKFDSSGALLWKSKLENGTSAEYCRSIKINSNGDIVLVQTDTTLKFSSIYIISQNIVPLYPLQSAETLMTVSAGTMVSATSTYTDAAGTFTNTNLTSAQYTVGNITMALQVLTPLGMVDSAATLTSTTTIQSTLLDAAASMTDSAGSMTSTTLTL
jgi:uncharacterized delta-60 repeat protein